LKTVANRLIGRDLVVWSLRDTESTFEKGGAKSEATASEATESEATESVATVSLVINIYFYLQIFFIIFDKVMKYLF
jgi:hypothetical protein